VQIIGGLPPVHQTTQWRDGDGGQVQGAASHTVQPRHDERIPPKEGQDGTIPRPGWKLCAVRNRMVTGRRNMDNEDEANGRDGINGNKT
jgi:hypothetical protein